MDDKEEVDVKHALLLNTAAGVIVSLLLVSHLGAQTLPAMLYGGPEDERCFGIVEAWDHNGYVLAGWTRSFGLGAPNNTNALVVRIDSVGIPLWARVAGGFGNEDVNTLIRTLDGGYAIAGFTRSFGIGTPDSANLFVIKYDPMGIYQWGWVYGTQFDERAHAIIQTSDGGYAVTGWTTFRSMLPPVKHNIFLLKLDPGGIPMWTTLYWFPLDLQDEGYALDEIPIVDRTQGYLIAGRARVTSTNSFDAFVIHVDSLGVPLFPVSIVAGLQNDQAYSVSWDGQGFWAAGYTNSYGVSAPAANIIVWKDDTAAGNPFGGYVYGWENDETHTNDCAAILASDKGFVLAGDTRSVGPGIPNLNFLIMKLDTFGVPMWTRVHPSIPGELAEQAFAITQTVNGIYGVAGYSGSSWTLGNDDFHFVTLDSLGNRPACVIDTPILYEAIPTKDTIILGEPNFIDLLEPIFSEDTMVEYVQICSIIPGIDESHRKDMPRDFSMFATYEYVALDLTRPGNLSVAIFDVSGRNVVSLADGMFGKGMHLFTIPKNLSAGVYVAQATFEGVQASVKIVKF